MKYPARMRNIPALSWLLLFAASHPTPRGFLAESGLAEVQWEDQYRALPDPAAIRENVRVLSAEPHHLGSPGDEKNSQWILSRFKEWGLDATIETF